MGTDATAAPAVAAVVLAAALAALAARLAVPAGRARLPGRPDAGTPRAPCVVPGASRPDASPAAGKLRAVATAGAALAALVVLPGMLAVGVAAVVAVAVWRRSATWESAAVRRRRARIAEDLPHVVDLLAACLVVGAAPGDALRRVVPLLEEPTRSELTVWTDRLSWGSDAVAVWTDLAGHPQLGRLGAALRRSADSGAPVVEALDRLSEDLRAVRRAEVEERVRQVEVRTAAPLGVCLLPAFLLLGVVPLVAGSALRLLAG